jgi:hypothetical protein
MLRTFRLEPAVIVSTFLLSLFLVDIAWPQLVNGRFVSSVYAWEQYDSVGVSNVHARGAQSVILDIGRDNFSLHTHMQMAATLDKTLDEEPDFRAFSLFAKFRNIGGTTDLTLGRTPYFVGVGTGTLDGALATLRFGQGAGRVSLLGGARVPNDLTLSGWKSLSTNYVLGTQVVVTSVRDTRIAASYVNRRRERASYWSIRPDSLYNPVSMYVVPQDLREQLLGLDAEYRFLELRLYGRYDYDLNGEQTQRGQIGVRYSIAPDFFLGGEFIHRAPRIWFGSFFSALAVSTVNEFEAGVDYQIDQSWNAFLRAALVDYSDDTSIRTTVGITHDHVSLMYRGSTGYAGELHSVNLNGAYPLMERRFVPNAAFSYGSYKLSETDERENLLAFTLGATFRPIRTVSVDLQGQVVNNAIVESDFRIFGKLTLWFAEQLSIFE